MPSPSEFQHNTVHPIHHFQDEDHLSVATMTDYERENMREKTVTPETIVTEHAGVVTARLRQFWGISLSEWVQEATSEEDYIRLIINDDPTSDNTGVMSNMNDGKQKKLKERHIEFNSCHQQYIHYSLSSTQFQTMLSSLPDYYTHVTSPHNDTLLPKIVCLYTVSTPLIPTQSQQQHFMVCVNPVQGTNFIHQSHNIVIGGNRRGKEGVVNVVCDAEQKIAIEEDNRRKEIERVRKEQGLEEDNPAVASVNNNSQNLENRDVRLPIPVVLRPNQSKALLQQLRRDVEWLCTHQHIQYQWRIGVHDKTKLSVHLNQIISLTQSRGLRADEREVLCYVKQTVNNNHDRDLRSHITPLGMSYAPPCVNISAWNGEEGAMSGGVWEPHLDSYARNDMLYFVSLWPTWTVYDVSQQWTQWWTQDTTTQTADPVQYALSMSKYVQEAVMSYHSKPPKQ